MLSGARGRAARHAAEPFHQFSPHDTARPRGPLGGVDGGLGVASPAEVAQAVVDGLPDGARRDNDRTVYVFCAKGDSDERFPVGVFLTGEDGAEAARLAQATGPGYRLLAVPVVL
ncbi:hypothetical protein AB0C12_31565 [Actinoplanes sp. NPDC048967]|uniref:hypothetical protein n=1 Tax=Actinoplanes sp. NPDC048967 TaxID=3155269 RepID=UPI0033F39A90